MKKGIFLLLLLCIARQAYPQHSNNDNTFVVADILIWKLREGSADNWAQIISPSGNQQSVSVLSMPFKWDAAYRVGIGRNKLYDCWDTTFYYTFFKSNTTSEASVSSGGIYSPFLGNFYINNPTGTNFGPNYLNANIKWKFIFNVYDLELGRKININRLLSLRPFIGIKAGTIKQHVYSIWQNPTVATNFTTAFEDIQNNFKGIGPSIGLDTDWAVFNCDKCIFKVFGNFSGALLAGHWNFSDNYSTNAPMSGEIINSSFNSAAPMARALVGIEWNNCVYKGILKLRIGYEAQVWFNQLKYYSFNTGRMDNLLSLQGGLLDIGYYF